MELVIEIRVGGNTLTITDRHQNRVIFQGDVAFLSSPDILHALIERIFESLVLPSSRK